MLEHGWLAHYTNRRYGHGLLPDTFEAYKKQRHRWAYGGLQIVRSIGAVSCRAHAGLTREQKREFALGWLNWLGAESVGVVVAILNLIWVPVVAFVGIAIPDKILTLPILAAFAVSIVHFVALYRLRVAIPAGQTLGAMFAAMSLQWTVARAVGFGLIKDHLPFVRTAKGGATPQGRGLPGLLRGGARRAAGDRRDHRCSRPTTRRCARSTCSRWCWWCRACRSCRRPRWPRSKARASTISRSGRIERSSSPRSGRQPGNRLQAAEVRAAESGGSGAVDGRQPVQLPTDQAGRDGCSRICPLGFSPASPSRPAAPNRTCRAGSPRR